jgi:energy-coupling factor transporter ATP-binding protein EcfA2
MSDSLKKLILIVASQIPVFAGGLAWADRLRQRPAAALALAALYELGIFLLAFGKKVWGKLEDSTATLIADSIKNAFRGFAPGFRRRYKKQIIRDYGIVNFLGLGIINTYALGLEQVFVDLRIDSTNPQKLNVNPVAAQRFERKLQIWDFLRKKNRAALGNSALAIVGPPGCGKTTLLKHLALTFASNRQRSYGLHSATPILLLARQHAKVISSAKPPSLGTLVADYLGDQNLFATLKPPADWFPRELERGCLILFDGLDEVANLEQRRAVRDWLDIQIKNYDKCRFILTSRPIGYREAPLQRAHVLEVQPFDVRQVRTFLENWILANEIAKTGEKPKGPEKRRMLDRAHSLLEQLSSLPAVYDLTVNPLLLTMIAMVCEFDGALPKSRVELYQRILNVLLGEWQKAKGISDNLEPEQKLAVLRVLASHLMTHRKRDIGEKDVASLLREPLAQLGITGSGVEKFISELESNSGILVETENGKLGFAHLTFQEYLTASQWANQDGLKLELYEIIPDSWWYETLRLFAGMSNATDIIRTCLDINDVSSLMLAVDCLEENAEVNAEVRREVVARVLESLESEDPERRRISAEVKLSRRLRHSFRRLDSEREVDTKEISCAEYQLFIDEMRARGKFCHPDFWQGHKFEAGQADHPIYGMRAEDAATFCAWLTEKKGGTLRYRLPGFQELDDSAVNENATASWCQHGGYFAISGSDAGVLPLKREPPPLTLIPPNMVLASQPDFQTTFDSLPSKWAAILSLATALGLSDPVDQPLAEVFAGSDKLTIRDRLISALDRNPDHSNHVFLEETMIYLLKRMREAALASYFTGRYPRERARHVEMSLLPILYAIYEKDLVKAKLLSEALKSDPNSVLSRFGRLLSDIFLIPSLSEQEKFFQRAVLTRLMEETWRGLTKTDEFSFAAVYGHRQTTFAGLIRRLLRPLYRLGPFGYQERRSFDFIDRQPRANFAERARRWWRQFRNLISFRNRNQGEFTFSDKKDVESSVLNAYWWLELANARSIQAQRPREGIRLVREAMRVDQN